LSVSAARRQVKKGAGGSEFSPECRHDRSHEKQEGRGVVPANSFAEVEPGENGEHGERNALLNDLELVSGELAVADSIGGHLKAIFAKGDQPTDHDGLDDGCRAVFQMPVPGHCHEGV